MPIHKPILLVSYTHEWAVEFARLKNLYLHHLSDKIVSVEHVGSTAVPRLCAKPVIDIDIVIDSTEELSHIIPILVGLGYQYLGEVAIPERFVFRPPSSSAIKHHLYCCIKGSAALRNHLILRNALRNDNALAEAYAVLKRNLALSSRNMTEYVMGKTAFIAKVLSAGGMSHSELEAIAEQNKSVIP